MKSINNITAKVTIAKKENPIMIENMLTKILSAYLYAQPKIKSKNTLDNYPCAKDKAHNLK